MAVSNNLLGVLVIAAIAMSVTGTMLMMSALPRQPVATTGYAQLTATGTATVTIPAEVGIILLVDTVDFGTIAAIAGTTNDTTDNSPHPFVLENNGSVVINVSIAEDNISALWLQDDSCENCFQFNSTVNGTTASVQLYDWTDFSPANQAENSTASDIVTDPANLVYNLSQDDTDDAINVHLNISVPSGEAAGVKSANIYFNAAQG